MTRIETQDPATATGAVRTIFERVERGLGRVPNALRVLGASPSALQVWWEAERALARGTLSPALREQLAVLTATTNGCRYCATLHAGAAGHLGVDAADIDGARHARAADPAAAAALRFARAAMEARGDVDDATLAAVRGAGFADGQLLEILAVVAINSFNNACNRLARTEDDPVDR